MPKPKQRRSTRFQDALFRWFTRSFAFLVLAILLGIWFFVMGFFEIIGSFLFRRALRTEGPPAE